jgi:hypothetical protein
VGLVFLTWRFKSKKIGGPSSLEKSHNPIFSKRALYLIPSWKIQVGSTAYNPFATYGYFKYDLGIARCQECRNGMRSAPRQGKETKFFTPLKIIKESHG